MKNISGDIMSVVFDFISCLAYNVNILLALYSLSLYIFEVGAPEWGLEWQSGEYGYHNYRKSESVTI